MKLARAFYTRANVQKIAQELLGKRLCVRQPDGKVLVGLITETEAYQAPEDKASHAFGNRRTKRTETMFQVGGTSYVYTIYGLWSMFNVVTNKDGVPHAVLVRALEPVKGFEAMKKHLAQRKKGRGKASSEDEQKLCSGPGKLCQAMGIDKSYNLEDLLGTRIWIEEGEKIPKAKIHSGPRIGIDYAEEFTQHPWRYWIAEHSSVSRLIR